VRLASEYAVAVITDHGEHLFGGGHVLTPFTGGKNPEHEKGEQDQPGQPHKIVYVDRSSETQQGEGVVHFKTGDQ
jgi:hypothetical protein